MPCQLIKQTATRRTCGYGRKVITYRFLCEITKENVHLTTIVSVKCSWPYLYKSPCKTKNPEAIMNEIRVASFRRPCRSKREAARQLTSHSNNAQNTIFRFQSYNYDFSHYATAQEIYWWSLRHYFCCSFITWIYRTATPNILSVSVLFLSKNNTVQ
jgi:hypothetical protein